MSESERLRVGVRPSPALDGSARPTSSRGSTPSPSAGWAAVSRWFGWFRQRVEAKAEARGLIYPWWIPVGSTVGIVGCALVAVAQRDGLVPPSLLILAAILAATPCLLDFVMRRWVPWQAHLLLVGAAVAWLLLSDRSGFNPAADLAPPTLAVTVGELAAIETARRALLSAGLSAVLVVALSPGAGYVRALNVSWVFLGLAIGMTLHWQMRALAAERDARNEERERATLAERQRVAREVHDLVAHSMSVTMLHVTAARRSLTEDADVPEAIEALEEAERVGRRAMSDIRRTVSVLRTDAATASSRPLPGAQDIDSLVDDLRGAGVALTYRSSGELSGLDDGIGLAVFRVLQEAVANATKHVPEAPVDVRLDVTDAELSLVVTNPRPPGAPVATDGSGLLGMASRAQQLDGRLSAGPAGTDDDVWRVDLRVPLRTGP